MAEPRTRLKLVRSAEDENLSDLADDDLMLLLRRDHIKAFEALVVRHQKMIQGYACRFLGCTDLGEEVAQEVFLTLWTERMRYSGQGQFKSFLLKLVYNRCHVFARGRQRHRKKMEKLEACVPALESDNAPLRCVVESVRSGEIQRALAEIPEPMRHAIVLRYNSGLSIREIAEITGKPAGTVKSNLFRGLKLLHKVFTGDNP